VRDSRPWIAGICDDLVDRVCQRGACDVVRDLAAPLPMIVIGDLLGVAAEDRDELLAWSDDLLGSLGGSEHIEAAAAAFSAFDEYARRTIEDRRAAPRDDLVSVLVHAEVEGQRLGDDELVFEMLLILIGGDESARHVISGGVEQLLRCPDERARLVGEPALLPLAVEEMLRWVTPVKSMTRTVTREVELGGATLQEGDKLLLLYESANFDDAQFEDPLRFDVGRTPNDHLAFGFGPHHCLGANLARMEIGTMVECVLARLPDLELAAPGPFPTFLGGLLELPVTFTPSAPRG
jgi:cytochrome P450 family 142 subfamily A polypeptide 1